MSELHRGVRLAMAAVVVSCVMLGCTFVIRPAPNPVISGKKIPLKVALLIDEDQMRQFHFASGLAVVGMAHGWVVETGTALRQGAENAFCKMFSSVRALRTQSEFSDSTDLTLLVTPKVDRFAISQALAADMELSCILVNRADSVIYSGSVPARGKARMAEGCLLGVAGGKTAISSTSTEAFNRAFALLAEDIRKKVDFAPYLNR